MSGMLALDITRLNWPSCSQIMDIAAFASSVTVTENSNILSVNQAMENSRTCL